MKHFIFSLFILSALTLVTGCKKELSAPDKATYANTPRGNFEAFWNGINTNYVFFDIDTLNWNAQYKKYVSRIKDNMTDDELAAVLEEMSYPLIDGHFAINMDKESYSPVEDKFPHPDLTKMLLNLVQDIPQNYLDAGYTSLDDPNTFLGRFGTIKHQIQYLSLNSFGLRGDAAAASKIRQFVQNPPAGTKGFILDLRGCAGGETTDVTSVVSMFTDKAVQGGSLRFKPGAGRFGYGPLLPLSINPSARPNTLPCVVLIDQSTFSAGEFTALIMSQLPQVTVMGAKTYGAMGDVEGATFTLPNGWGVQTALCAWKFTDGKYYEGKGVTPDVAVPLDLTQLDNHTDNQLEAAIQKIAQ